LLYELFEPHPVGGGTTISYELTAKPGFDVPEFILKTPAEARLGR